MKYSAYPGSSQRSRRTHLAGGTPSGSGGGAQGGGAGGSGGGTGGSAQHPPPYRPDINQQIAMALMRLQQDMSSVLTRLNTLETLTVSQHHVGDGGGGGGDTGAGQDMNRLQLYDLRLL